MSIQKEPGSDPRVDAMGGSTDSPTAAINETTPATVSPHSPLPLQVIDGHVYAASAALAPFTDLNGVHRADFRSGLIALVYSSEGISPGFIVRACNNHQALIDALKAIVAADDVKSLAGIVEAMPAARAALANAEAREVNRG